MKRFASITAGIFIITAMSLSCGKTPLKPHYTATDSVLLYVKETMDRMYLWQDKMTRVEWRDYTNPARMLADMVYLPVDKWSNVYEQTRLKSFLTGEATGYGFMPAWEGNELMVASVYTDTEAHRKGLRRGYRIALINGRMPQGMYSWDFFNTPLLGETISLVAVGTQDTLRISISANTVTNDYVLHREVISVSGKKCGYVVYESFTEDSKQAIVAAMEDFRVLGISELIIDLRYNGGGETSVLMSWMSKILPARLSGKPFFITRHNAKVSYLNKADKVFPNATSLGMERVFVISSQRTASASEALINCLKPYIEVHHIGDRTHGKPVGMYVYDFKGWYVVPISFEYTNIKGEGGFYDGILPEQYAYDDKSLDWGNPNDPCLAQAIHYIKHEAYQPTILSTRLKSSRPDIVPLPPLGLYTLMPNQLSK